MYQRVQIIVLFCSTIFLLGQSSPLPQTQENSTNTNETQMLANVKDARIGIILSPILTAKMIREIAIYWQIEDLRRGDDKLTLYDGPPEVNGSIALYNFEPNESSGVQKTKLSGEFVATSELTYQEQCLKYYVAWHRNDTIQKTKCLATHPNWMSQRNKTLGTKRLNEIFIPGTHDSSSYQKKRKAEQESIVTKYVLTQDEDILSQLIYGVRYLDIRVACHFGPGTIWWANHGVISVHPLQTIINDVKSFLNNTQEIVIFDIHRFAVGFDIQPEVVHNEFIAYLEEQFAGYFLPKTSKGWSMTLNEIWATGKRLIIGYNKKDVYPKHEITWEPISHRWPDVKTMDKLYKKIDAYESGRTKVENSNSPRRAPSSVMAQFTPEALDVILDLLGGIRKMAEEVNMNITQSYNNKWRCSANIVSMDYIKGSGIIEAALEWNDKRPLVC